MKPPNASPALPWERECVFCHSRALDHHLTCGSYACNEGAARSNQRRNWFAEKAAILKARRLARTQRGLNA